MAGSDVSSGGSCVGSCETNGVFSCVISGDISSVVSGVVSCAASLLYEQMLPGGTLRVSSCVSGTEEEEGRRLQRDKCLFLCTHGTETENIPLIPSRSGSNTRMTSQVSLTCLLSVSRLEDNRK